ncbi:MAG: EI24 domain-containing protein [Planctomycetota bacterium]|jgi:CysZ protein|nr:EI24 domain-containing protein [Planctomycetota bacterium]
MGFEEESGNVSRLADLAAGLYLPFRGAALLLGRRGVKRYAALPFLINLVLYVLAFGVFVSILWNWNFDPIAWDFWGPAGRWISGLLNRLDWLMKLVAALLVLTVAFFTFTSVGMVLASPFNDLLSERVEVSMKGGNGREPVHSPGFGQTLRNTGHSLLNLFLQILFTLPALPALLLPGIGFLPLLLVSGWFAGFGFIDIPMARHCFLLRAKWLAMSRLFWKTLGFGLAMQACFAVPVVGLLLLPVGVAAGTLAFVEDIRSHPGKC